MCLVTACIQNWEFNDKKDRVVVSSKSLLDIERKTSKQITVVHNNEARNKGVTQEHRGQTVDCLGRLMMGAKVR